MGDILFLERAVSRLTLLEGGNWNNSAHCGSGSRNGNNERSTLNTNNSAQGLIHIPTLTAGKVDMLAENISLLSG